MYSNIYQTPIDLNLINERHQCSLHNTVIWLELYHYVLLESLKYRNVFVIVRYICISSWWTRLWILICLMSVTVCVYVYMCACYDTLC